MTGVPWRPVLFALGVVLNLAVGYLLVRRVRMQRRSAGSGADHDVDRAEGAVECPSCGAENDLEFRYCRECVEELPGGSPLDRSIPSASNGLLR